jgi:hypothetical protein
MAAQLWETLAQGMSRAGEQGIIELIKRRHAAIQRSEALSPSDVEEAKTLALISRTLYMKQTVPDALRSYVLCLSMFAKIAVHGMSDTPPDRIPSFRQTALREIQYSVERCGLVSALVIADGIELFGLLGRTKEGSAFGRSYLPTIESSVDPDEPHTLSQAAFAMLRLSHSLCKEAVVPRVESPSTIRGMPDKLTFKPTDAERRLLLEAESLARKALDLMHRSGLPAGSKEVG